MSGKSTVFQPVSSGQKLSLLHTKICKMQLLQTVGSRANTIRDGFCLLKQGFRIWQDPGYPSTGVCVCVCRCAQVSVCVYVGDWNMSTPNVPIPDGLWGFFIPINNETGDKNTNTCGRQVFMFDELDTSDHVNPISHFAGQSSFVSF